MSLLNTSDYITGGRLEGTSSVKMKSLTTDPDERLLQSKPFSQKADEVLGGTDVAFIDDDDDDDDFDMFKEDKNAPINS